MKTCKYCNAKISDSFDVCPICTAKIERTENSNYPVYKCKRDIKSLYLTWSIRVLIISTIISVVVNIIVGGIPWSLYVITGIYLFYKIFLSRKLIEANLIQKFLTVAITVCLLLIAIRLISTDMLNVQIVIPNILYGALIVSGGLYFFDFQSQKSHILPIIFTIGVAILCIAILFVIFGVIRWPMIVLGGVSLFIIVFSLLFYRKSIIAEIKKKIHT